MSNGKKIIDLPLTKSLPDNIYFLVDDGKKTYRTDESTLYKKIHAPKTIAQAKSAQYEKGETITIVDYSTINMAHGEFMCFIYTKKPSWFDKDIPNCIYEVSGSDGKTLLINLALSSSSELILTQDQATSVQHLLNNTGKIFYEPSKKTLCVMVDNVIKAITLQPMEKQS